MLKLFNRACYSFFKHIVFFYLWKKYHLKKNLFFSKIRLAVFFILLVAAIGVTGYHFIEGYSFIESLYMTMITISTVGFREVQPLSNVGKLFTIFLILISLGTVAYAVSVVTTHFIEAQVNYLFRGTRQRIISKKMKDHVIICGFGRNGHQAAFDLSKQNKHCVVIDKNQEAVNDVKDMPGVVIVVGDATDDDVLLKAGIKNAKALIATLPIDADNLYITLTSRFMNPEMKIISRASSEASERKLKMAGADSVVMPERVGGSHMARLVARPDIVEFLEHLSYQGENPTNMEEISCDDLPDSLESKTIFEIGIRRATGANIVGYKSPDGVFILNPSPDSKLLPGSKIFVLGNKEQIGAMKRIFKTTH